MKKAAVTIAVIDHCFPPCSSVSFHNEIRKKLIYSSTIFHYSIGRIRLWHKKKTINHSLPPHPYPSRVKPELGRVYSSTKCYYSISRQDGQTALLSTPSFVSLQSETVNSQLVGAFNLTFSKPEWPNLGEQVSHSSTFREDESK